MKLYQWNVWALGLALGACLLTHLGYTFLSVEADDKPFWIGFLIYFLAYPALGWAVVRSVWWAIQGSVTWGQSLALIAVSLVQGLGTLMLFIILLAEGYTGYTNR